MADSFVASNQWANRPADERFWTFEELHENALTSMRNSVNVERQNDALNVQMSDEGNLQIVGPRGNPLDLTYHAAGQVCNAVKAPREYLTRLSHELATQCLRYGWDSIRENKPDDTRHLLVDTDRSIIRSFVSNQYNRVWDTEVLNAIQPLVDTYGWQAPPARPNGDPDVPVRVATEEDCLPGSPGGFLSISPGDQISPSGLYRSDSDMFVFLVNEQNRVDDGSSGGLGEGLIIQNSEVGRKQFSIQRFKYRMVCGNHIIWGIQQVEIKKIRHRGDGARDRIFEQVQLLMQSQEDILNPESSVNDDLARRIEQLQNVKLAEDQDTLIEVTTANKRWGLGKRQALDVLNNAQSYVDEDGDPYTVWGWANAITRYSQDIPNADERLEMDDRAGILLATVESNLN